jgi:hypothetical protein
MAIDIAGWGSTKEAGPKPYRYVPVQIVPPGNVDSVSGHVFFPLLSISTSCHQTGDNFETLRIVEASIQADFKNGLPPHLQAEAKSKSYTPGSDQSRIFVASHSEFSSLRDRDIQRILRHRLILVHGNPMVSNFGWDLESFGQVHDVDGVTTIHGVICILLLNIFTETYDQFPQRWIPMTPRFPITKERCGNFTRFLPPYQMSALLSMPFLYHLIEEIFTPLPSLGAWHRMK